MEELLHYTWKHKLFPLGGLQTTDGKAVEVLDVGLHNRNAGPDFFNAKVKIDGTLWVGNVEIHDKSSDWFAHHHQSDARYDNVVLHVVGVDDAQAITHAGLQPPQVRLDVPQTVRDNYRQLLATDSYPPCYRIVPQLSSLTVHSWMSVLQTERLEQKTQAIARRVADCGGSWEAGYFATLAHNFGFGVNGEAFEQWSRSLPLHDVAHHRDDIFQIEALFLGQAGLLQEDMIPEKYRQHALAEGYFKRLQSEYKYLAHKFHLTPMQGTEWKYLRLRPQNFPNIRIAQLANLYFSRRAGLSQLVECENVKQAEELLQTHVTPYWQTHYVFGNESAANEKRLSKASLALLIINTVVPIFFAYGRHKADEALCQRAFDFLDQLKAEANHVVKMWQEVGLEVKTAGDSQALIQLKKEYCDRKECLRCRIGYEYLKGSPVATHP